MLFRRKLMILCLGLLIAMTPIAPGGTYNPPAWLEMVKSLGRLATYAAFALMFVVATLNLVTRPTAAKPGVIVWTYSAFYLLAALKFIDAGLWGTSATYFGVILLYLVTFGMYLPKLERRGLFDLGVVVTAIGVANVIILLMNIPLVPVSGAYSYTVRFAGWAFNANVFAYSLTLTSCCLYAVTRNIRRFGGLVLLLLLAANFSMIFLTLSRGALIIFCVSLVMNFYFFSRRLFSIGLVFSPIFGALAALYIFDSPIYRLVYANRQNTRGWVGLPPEKWSSLK